MDNSSNSVLLEERDLLQERDRVLELGQEGLQELSDKNALLNLELFVDLAEQNRPNELLSNLEDESSRTSRNNLLQQCRDTVAANERTTQELRTEVSNIAVVNVELQEQLSVFRAKLNEAEVNLSEKTAIVEVLRSEGDEYRRGQESMTKKIEKLCGEIGATKKMLAETEKKLEMASTKKMAEKKTASTEKKHLLDVLESKMSAFEVDLSSSVDARADTHEKVAQMNGVENETENATETSVANDFEEFVEVAYLEQKRRVDQIQSDILKEVCHFADLEKCKSEATDVRKKFWAEFHQLKEELKTARATRESLQAEIESLRSENVQEALESTQIRTVRMLTKRVDGLTNSENDLNRAISQLENDLLHHDSDALQNKVVNSYLKVDLDDAQERLSKLAAAMDIHEVKATQESSVSDKMFTNNEQRILREEISTLNNMVDSLKSNNGALQNRLNLALANFRRMETLLHEMTHIFSAKSTQPELKLQENQGIQAIQDPAGSQTTEECNAQ